MPISRSPLSLIRAGTLCLALLLSQWLGHAHAVAHAGGSGPATAAGHAHGQAEGHAHAHPDGHADAHGTWAHALGGEHEAGDTACRLIDQLSHADGPGPGSAPLVLPLPAAAPVAWARRVALSNTDAAAYLARAPPRG